MEAPITSTMVDALEMMRAVGPLSESNKTSAVAATIYWQTAHRLADAGLIAELDKDSHMRRRWWITPEGGVFLDARAAHQTPASAEAL